jgi:threonine dehydrogenase-like Zn-dependent dehydrogenase
MTNSSICGSDLHLLGPGWVPRREVYGIGHEAVGEVIEVGAACAALRPGDKVMLAGSVGCGLCRPCLARAIKRCANGATDVYGIGQGLEGCQAELIRVPAGDFNAMRVPDGITDEQAVLLTDGLVTAFAACLGAEVRSGNTVAVIGLGPMGLMAVELAYAMGAAVVVAIDPIPERRTRAEMLGAVTSTPEVAEPFVTSVTGGRMIDSVIEAVGRTETVDLALAIVGVGRTVNVLGSGQNVRVEIPYAAAVNGVTVRANMLTEIARYWSQVVPMLLAGRIRPERVFSDSFTLADGIHAYARAGSRDAGLLKVLLQP